MSVNKLTVWVNQLTVEFIVIYLSVKSMPMQAIVVSLNIKKIDRK
jgi:hypothetical protein